MFYDLKLEMGKKCYFQYNLNIHILNQSSTTLEKDLKKGFDPLKLSHPSVFSPRSRHLFMVRKIFHYSKNNERMLLCIIFTKKHQ